MAAAHPDLTRNPTAIFAIPNESTNVGKSCATSKRPRFK